MQKKPTDISNLAPAKGAAVALADLKLGGKVGSKTTSSTRNTTTLKQESETCPFRALVKEWLAAGRSARLSSRTLEDYQEKLFKFWWWWDKFYAAQLGVHPKNVTVREARAYATYLREPQDYRWGLTTTQNKRPLHHQILSSVSIASYGRSVKVFFSWLEQEGYIEISPFCNKSVKFTSQKRDTVLKKVSEEDLARLFSALTSTETRATFAGSRNLAMVALLFDSGMRRGELLSMRLEDLDLEKGRCIIRGKTGQRTAIFSELCKVAISEYWQNYRIFQDTKPSSGV